MDKDFLSKSAYATPAERAPRGVLSIIEVTVATVADATGSEPIFLADGSPVGGVSSGAYGYLVSKSLALGYLKNASPGTVVQVMIFGQPHKDVILAEPPFGPKGERLRAWVPSIRHRVRLEGCQNLCLHFG